MINGHRYYFGTDWKGALAKYEAFIGETPKVDGFVIADLVERFMDHKELQVEANEIKPDTMAEYKRTCDRLIEILGKWTSLAGLEPSHFMRLRAELAKQMSVVTLKGQLVRLRTMFEFAFEVGLVEVPLRYKTSLKAPAARLIRQSKNKTNKLFTSVEISALTKAASGFMAPAIWLGINCGLGNTDVCNLKWSHIKGRWLEFPRVKTGVTRRSYLWSETVAAIDKWYSDSIESEYVCQGVYGQKLGAGDSNSTPIAHLFSAITESCKIEGRGFYALRHTYRTIADGAGDEPAVYLTMGHSDSRIGANYRHRIEDSRLIAVSNFVREWLG